MILIILKEYISSKSHKGQQSRISRKESSGCASSSHPRTSEHHFFQEAVKRLFHGRLDSGNT